MSPKEDKKIQKKGSKPNITVKNLLITYQRSDIGFQSGDLENLFDLMDFAPADIDSLPWENYDMAYLGEIAHATLQKEKLAVNECLQEIYDCLSKDAEENTFFHQIDGLEVNLLPHQKLAINWLLHRENCKPSGGLLGLYILILFTEAQWGLVRKNS